MTLRNSWAKRPPFPFSHRARAPNLPCKPVISRRAPSGTFFAEIAAAPGPQVIGETGDNSHDTLFGREWIVVWCSNDLKLHAFQEDADTRGVWHAVTTSLPPVFDAPLPETARRVSFAFDQSARMIVAYEDEEVVKVTRWDPTSSQYLQNVSFPGVDPFVAMDASWAHDIPNSDVLLFYLSTDRERVMCRVQQEVYAVEHEMHDYGTAVILDRVTPLFLQYEVLTSDGEGNALPDVLLSELYPYLTGGDIVGEAVFTAAAAYELVVLAHTLAADLGVVASPPSQGEYILTVQTAAAADTDLVLSILGPADGAYAEVVISKTLAEGLTVTAAAPTTAEYVLVVITHQPVDDLLMSAAGPAGGSYETA